MEKKCPTCNKLLTEEKSPSWPFCSARCRMIDLGKWMNEDYRVPLEQNINDTAEQEDN